MGRGTVVRFDAERRKRRHRAGSAHELPLTDPSAIALRVCQELDALAKRKVRWIPIPLLCKRLNLSQQAVVGAAVYGHVRGWMICTPFSLLLCDEGRAQLRRLDGQSSWDGDEIPLSFAMPRAAGD
jgi:hypothetical protein